MTVPRLNPTAVWWQLGNFRFKRARLVCYGLHGEQSVKLVFYGSVETQTLICDSPNDAVAVVEFIDVATGLTRRKKKSGTRKLNCRLATAEPQWGRVPHGYLPPAVRR